MDATVFDLFGNPVRAGKGGRGRPTYEATEKDRNKVKLLLALGWSNQRVSNALAISLATLKRYFRAELAVRDQMRDRLDARRLEQAMELSLTGNVGAMRQLDRLIEKQDLAGAEKRARREADDREEEETGSAYVGKKETAARKAQAVSEGDSAWGGLLKPGSYDA